MSTGIAQKSSLLTTIISSLLCVIIFAILRFNADWFAAAQVNTIIGGFVSSWLGIFILTCVSNVEMLVFGNAFQAKFIPEIVFCFSLAIIAAGVVHRVCATSCIIFSVIGLYFINRISTNYHSKGSAAGTTTASNLHHQQLHAKKSASKKNK